MPREKMKIPRAALQLVEAGEDKCFARVDPTSNTLQMTIYSGGIIKDHWLWGNLAVDLSGIRFAKAKYPILENHDQRRKIGFMNKPVVGEGLSVDKATYVDTPESEEFQKLSKDGFPYEASMYAKPGTIERIGMNETAECNGLKVRGPGTIWRQCVFMEASVCVFGYDSDTRSVAMSESEEIDVTVTEREQPKISKRGGEVKTNMTRTEFMEKYGDDAKGILEMAEGVLKPEVETKLKADHDTAMAAKQAEVDAANANLQEKADEATETGKRIKKLELADEKREAEADERKLAEQADTLWTEHLSQIPDYLHGKLKKQVSYQSFVKDGVLDEEKFTETIKAEAEEWASFGINTEVHGGVGGGKEPTGKDREETRLAAEDDDSVANMLVLAGDAKDLDEAKKLIEQSH